MMTELLKIKDALQRLYGKYDTIISHVLKFAAAFVSFMLIRGMTGYNGLASNVFIIILLSAVCAFLPAGVTTMCGCGLIILQLYGLERIWRLELCWSAQLSAHVLRCRYRKCIPVHFQVCSDRNDPCKCDQSDPCVCTECEDQIQKHDQSFLLSSIYAWKPDRWIYF